MFNHSAGEPSLTKQDSQLSTLIATLGTEAQVVTAVLDLLRREGERIGQVVVLHTAAPGALAAAVERLRADFEARPGSPTCTFVPLLAEGGGPLMDVETPEAVRGAFMTLYRTAAEAKRSGTRVHLSIAGGRKSLALFGMLTAQLLFEDEDRLWYLASSGDFLASKRLHPVAGDAVTLIPIPVAPWSPVSPARLEPDFPLDPYAALERQAAARLEARLVDMRAFVLGSLTPAEARVVALLVREGLDDHGLAARLYLSPRTVEGQLRSAYQKAASHWDLPRVDRTQLVALLNLYFTYQQNAGNPA